MWTVTELRSRHVYSFFALTSKIAQGVAQLAAGYILGFSGYLNPSEQEEQGVTGQSTQVQLVMGLLVALFPAFLRLCGVLVVLAYSITSKRMRRKLCNTEDVLILSDSNEPPL